MLWDMGIDSKGAQAAFAQLYVTHILPNTVDTAAGFYTISPPSLKLYLLSIHSCVASPRDDPRFCMLV